MDNRLDLQFLGTNKLETESTFSILCEGHNNQILQISIPPNCSNYLRGRMVYTSNSQEVLPEFSRTFANLFSKGINMHLWRNRSQQMQIVGMTHLRNRGPLLILDMSVYKESLYVNLNYVIACKYTLENSITLHPKLPTHQLIQFKDKAASLEDYFKNNQKIALQATSPIIQKYLGPAEPFFIHFGDILAVSESMQVEKSDKGMRLVGPGWVFFQASSLQSRVNLKMASVFLIFFMTYTLMQIFLLL